MYLTYLEYQEMGGTLDETAFNRFSSRAEGLINKYTYRRLIGEDDIPEAVKRCMFGLITIVNQQEQTLSATSGMIASRSNDGVSESYVAMSPDSIYQNLNSQIEDIIKGSLTGVYNSKKQRLLFKGRYANE